MKAIFSMFFALLVIPACANVKLVTHGASNSDNDMEQRKIEITPGGIRLASFIVNSKDSDGDVYCRGEKLPSHLNRNRRVFAVAESYFSDLKPFVCELKAAKKVYDQIDVVVVEKEFPFEELKVDSKRVELSKKDLARVKKEQALLKMIYDSFNSAPIFIEEFDLPMKNIISSDYGKKRLFNKKKQSQHLGTDFKSYIGEKVFASNAGKVVYAGDLFFSGKTVIVDHGLGIFSMYGHLSKTKVKKGTYIPKGELVGLTGATGRVTGPHLHWGVKVHGNWIDGVELIKESSTLKSKFAEK